MTRVGLEFSFTTSEWIKLFHEEDLDGLWDLYSEGVKKLKGSKDLFKKEYFSETEGDTDPPVPIIYLKMKIISEESTKAVVSLSYEVELSGSIPGIYDKTFGLSHEVELVKEDNLWKIDDIFGLKF